MFLNVSPLKLKLHTKQKDTATLLS